MSDKKSKLEQAAGIVSQASGIAGQLGGIAGQTPGIAGQTPGIVGQATGAVGNAAGMAGQAAGIANQAAALAGPGSGLAKAATAVGQAAAIAGQASSIANAASGLASSLAAAASAFKRPAANASWFTLKVDGLEMAVYAFEGVEELSKPFAFSVEVVSTDNAFALKNVLGKAAVLSITDRSNGTRLVHGYIREAEQLHSSNKYTHYRYEIAPKIHFLGLNRGQRIFQNLSIVEIIKKIFTEQGVAGGTYEFQLQNSYAPREYCLQYGESDLHFISRLCEEEGVYFYFEHLKDKHVMIFADAPGGPAIPGPAPLRFFTGSGQVADQAVIARLSLHEKINSDTATYRDWNFEQPAQDLLASKNEADDAKAPVHGGVNYDHYEYPHLYQEKGEGERYVNIQLLRQLTWHAWVNGETDVARLTPGFTFTLQGHGRMDLNRNWQVVKVTHQGEQPGVLQEEAPSERGMRYNATFTALPDDVRFVPEIIHKKILITGSQTAIVTGPKSEEIYPDKHGRVKVQFLWDREGKWDENTSCWVRVAQGWAGGQYGNMAIPRIGHEVIVSFLEGNPDRPIITGRVYHGLNTPPYELPKHKTRTVFKSLSTPGKEGEARGFNELRIEDRKGAEEIYVHAEKDVNTYTKNDWSDMVCANSHHHTGGSSYTKTDNETHVTLVKDRKSHLQANDHFTVDGNSYATIKNAYELDASGNINIKSGKSIILEAADEIILKVGGSFISISASSITEQSGRLMLNCGAPSPEAPAQAERLLPDPPKGAGSGEGPKGDINRTDEFLVHQTGNDKNKKIAATVSPKASKNVFQDITEEQGKKLLIEFKKAHDESYIKYSEDEIYMQEQGGWIMKSPDGTYYLQRLTPTGPIVERDKGDVGRLAFSFPNKIPPNAVGTFHTHPAPYKGEIVYPSDLDIDTAGKMGLPGMVFGPNMLTGDLRLKIYDFMTPKVGD